MPPKSVKVFFDGGCRPNPGPMEVAVVVRGAAYVFDELGTGTNGDAEWQALIHALELARDQGLENADLVGDSRAIVDAACMALETGQAGSPYATRFLELARAHPPRRVRWIKREQNLAGIALARRHPR